MLIDWFTVIAQIVNFLVLVALLKRFLYGPLIQAIDARERAIAAQIAEAEEKNRAAAESVGKAQAELAEAGEKQAQLLAAAREEAEKERGDMVQKARASVRAIESRWHDEIEREKKLFLDEMRARAATEILDIARAALGGLAGTDVERAAILAFLDQVRNLDPAALRLLAADEMIVATPGDLPPEMRNRIRETVEGRLGAPVRLRFESAPSMSCGIELRGSGQRIGWTPEAYVEALKEKLSDAFDRGAAEGCSLAA